jgi:pimeloyl-ACP methyl ester carboxylesterase
MSGNFSCGRDPVTNLPSSPRGADAWTPFSAILDRLSPETPWFASCHTRTSQLFMMSSANPSEPLPTDYTEASSLLSSLLRAKGATRLILVGHSYGAWQAVQTAARINGRLPVDLFTLDPVSPNVCNPAHSDGCGDGLTDLSDGALRHIADATNLWVNYYQTRGKIHSQPIAFADENHLAEKSHVAMDTLPEAWERLGGSHLFPNSPIISSERAHP